MVEHAQRGGDDRVGGAGQLRGRGVAPGRGARVQQHAVHERDDADQVGDPQRLQKLRRVGRTPLKHARLPAKTDPILVFIWSSLTKKKYIYFFNLIFLFFYFINFNFVGRQASLKRASLPATNRNIISIFVFVHNT